jgi:hypothetical protein
MDHLAARWSAPVFCYISLGRKKDQNVKYMTQEADGPVHHTMLDSFDY